MKKDFTKVLQSYVLLQTQSQDYKRDEKGQIIIFDEWEPYDDSEFLVEFFRLPYHIQNELLNQIL